MSGHDDLKNWLLRLEKIRQFRNDGIISNQEFIEDTFYSLIGKVDSIDEIILFLSSEEHCDIEAYARSQTDEIERLASLFVVDFNDQDQVDSAKRKVQEAVPIIISKLTT